PSNSSNIGSRPILSKMSSSGSARAVTPAQSNLVGGGSAFYHRRTLKLSAHGTKILWIQITLPLPLQESHTNCLTCFQVMQVHFPYSRLFGSLVWAFQLLSGFSSLATAQIFARPAWSR